MIEFTEPLLLALESQRHSEAHLAKRDRFLAMIAAEPGEHVLDVGCGSGNFCRALAPLVAPDGLVTGIDCSPAAVALATRLSTIENPATLTFLQQDGHALRFADASFDAVVCISVLGFCEHPERVMSEMWRVLRPGGRLLVANADEDTRIYNGRDRDLGRRMTRAIADRGRDPWLARRLPRMLTASGFLPEQEVVLVDLEREFAPETAGYGYAHTWRDYLLTEAGIPAPDYDAWLADLAACARDGSYCYSAVSYAHLARKSDGKPGESG